MKLDKKISYLNYILISLSLVPFSIFSFDYIANNLENLKYFYPAIPLVFSTYIIGVTIVSTKLTNHIKNKLE